MTKAFQTFADFIDIAIRENWCARIGCTTCGSHPFRAALREIPQEDVIVGLRGWSSGFLSNNADMFRLVVLEISDFGVYRVLRDLSGTPAGEQLRNDIDYWHRECERRKDYLASQTPEAIAARRVKKKADRALSTAPHRERKLALRAAVRVAAMEIDGTHPELILGLISQKNFGVPLRVIGGLVYERLVRHYRVEPIRADDLRVLSEFADAHSGHWKKLLDRVF